MRAVQRWLDERVQTVQRRVRAAQGREGVQSRGVEEDERGVRGGAEAADE